MGFHIWLIPFLFILISVVCGEEPDFNSSITFACVSHEKQECFEFFRYDILMGYDSGAIWNNLKSGIGLTMFVLGFGDAINITDPSGPLEIALAWHQSTGTNVCMVQYPYSKKVHHSLKYMKNTVEIRFNIVAKQTSDFIEKLMGEKVIKSLDDVVIAGFCTGAHIAASISRNLRKKLGQKVKALFGLDPAGLGKWLDEKNHIQKGDAKYVQSIHTSGLQGTLKRSLADNDVIVGNGLIQDGCKTSPEFRCSHFRAIEIFHITIIRQYRFVATNNGKKGTYTMLNEKDPAPTIKLGGDECLVGFYAIHSKSSLPKPGQFYIELPKKIFGKKQPSRKNIKNV